MGVVGVIEVTKYDKWMINEYNGSYSLVDCYEDRNGDYKPKFCTVKKYDGDEITIPKGLGGKFEDLKELRSMLLMLIKKVDAYDPADPEPSANDAGDGDDIPF
jgi:hypothetical protein